MQNESLDKALDVIIDAIDKSDINTDDKVELMINLRSFLSIMSYRHNVEVLEQERLRLRYMGGSNETSENTKQYSRGGRKGF